MSLSASPKFGLESDISYVKPLWESLAGNNLVGKHSQKFEPIFGGAKPHGMILEMVSKTLEANGHHNYASQSQHLCLH